MLRQYLEWVLGRGDSVACTAGKGPIFGFLDSLGELAVYHPFLSSVSAVAEGFGLAAHRSFASS